MCRALLSYIQGTLDAYYLRSRQRRGGFSNDKALRVYAQVMNIPVLFAEEVVAQQSKLRWNDLWFFERHSGR